MQKIVESLSTFKSAVESQRRKFRRRLSTFKSAHFIMHRFFAQFHILEENTTAFHHCVVFYLTVFCFPHYIVCTFHMFRSFFLTVLCAKIIYLGGHMQLNTDMASLTRSVSD